MIDEGAYAMNIPEMIEALNYALGAAPMPKKHFGTIRALVDALEAGTIAALPAKVVPGRKPRRR